MKVTWENGSAQEEMVAFETSDDVREVLRDKLNARPLPPLEAAAKFFRTYFADDSYEEAREQLSGDIVRNPNAVVRELEAIEKLLDTPPADAGALAHLVAWEANKPLDDSSGAGATVWLRRVAEMIRELMGDDQPPRLESTAAEKSCRDLRA